MSKKAPKIPQKEKLRLSPKFSSGSTASETAIKLLQTMIQTDTSNPPGNEIVLVEKLVDWIKKEWIDKLKLDFIKTHVLISEPTRASLVVEIIGSDPNNNPIWGFMSHIDVVPAEGQWKHPPFSGDITQEAHDRFLWGRGSLDVKVLGAVNLVTILTLLQEGFRPKGTIKILLMADEECGGHKGVKYNLEHHFDIMKVDCCLNEGGGYKLPIKDDAIIQIGEKGIFWTKFKVKGRGGHGSAPPPYNETAIFKMIRVLQNVRKHKPKVKMLTEYYNTINSVSLPNTVKFLVKRKRLVRGLAKLGSKLLKTDISQFLIPLVTNSISATNFHSGVKENSISPEAEIILDIRSLPGETRETINKMLKKIIGKKLFNELELTESGIDIAATSSGIDNKYYDILKNVYSEIYPGINLVPVLTPGSTDSKFYRERGMLAFGFSPMILDEDLTQFEFAQLPHNINERVSITNINLMMDFTYRIMSRV